MKPRLTIFGLFSFAFAAAPAIGQYGFADFTLSWTEVDASTHAPVPIPSGTLDPGEAARMSISVTFSPIGTVFQTGTGPGSVAGFAYTGFGLYSGSAGSWSDIGVPTGFVASPLFNPNTQNLLQQVWQPEPPLGGSPIPTNPIPSLWTVVWNPPNFQQRVVPFGLVVVFDQFPELFVRTGTDPQGNSLFRTVDSEPHMGSEIGIPIAPAPPVSAAAIFTLAFAARRRRPRHQPC